MTTKERGFAVMDQQKQREIARKGGRAAHQRGTAHEFTPEEAAKAGRKGGQRVSRDREHMARIGRKGGLASHQRTDTQTPPTDNPNGGTQRSLRGENHVDSVSSLPRDTDRMPDERPESALSTVHLSTEEIGQEGELDSLEMLAEGRMGNENATTEDNHGGVENGQGGHISERLALAEHVGGHGYGSFEQEKSPQMQ